jgi:ABC-type glycerol-3-phosphate transport system substrate-binding protein
MFVDDKTAAPMSTWVDQEIYKAFFDGKISIIQCLPLWVVALAKDPKYANFQLGIGQPLSGPKNGLNIGGSGYWSVAAGTKDPAAAWALVDWLGSPEVVNPFLVDAGLFPARTGVQPFVNDPLMTKFQKTQGPFTRLPLLTVSYWQPFMDECTAAFDGKKTSAQALADAATKINGLIKAGS